jgi:glycosyltransferase involved in cell wall biosynthesis
MKYPFVIVYRKDMYANIDTFLIEHSNALNCSIFITNSVENVKHLHNSNFHMVITYDASETDAKNEILTVITSNMLVRHIHINYEPNLSTQMSIDQFNNFINSVYINICSLDRVKTRPTFSLFTPSYNSYAKILRVYNSLMKQTLIDWEWVVVDDSPDDAHFQFLREHFKDPRIRFFRKSSNNGSIGNVKNETIGLCRGKYVLEMDHDDELMPYVLQESADLFDKNPTIGFIYFDCACVYENGNNQWYGDFICKGYGAYYSQKYNDKWRLIYVTPNINNITLSHLVCCPNHPRIWRRQTLLDMGNYSEYLPICDDYEIILRTAISTNIAKIHKLGYIQYMNDSNNNFSLIRNAEINRIGPNFISKIYYDNFKINQQMKDKNAYEDEAYCYLHSKIWERDTNTYQHNYCNLIVNNDYDKQYCIIGFDSLLANLDRITELYQNPRNDFIILDNKCSLSYLQNRIERYKFDRMKLYSLSDTPNEILINYFKLMYLSVADYEIINVDIQRPCFNTSMVSRSDIINKLTNVNDIYLEIGVEYGECFNQVHFKNKTGVDPDPKFNDKSLVKLTSDEYFATQDPPSKFNAIFIDGMHQVEYIVRDINNSLKLLADDGIIFIDDILPFNYNEQLKIPIKHYYENGILKYGENWTGDIWKVIYWMLVHCKKDIMKFEYYYNANFRGIGVLKFNNPIEIMPETVEAINAYDYFTDFPLYIKELETFSN